MRKNFIATEFYRPRLVAPFWALSCMHGNHPMPLQDSDNLAQRQADHIGVRPLNTLHQESGPFLDAVGSRLVQGLFRGHIG